MSRFREQYRSSHHGYPDISLTYSRYLYYYNGIVEISLWTMPYEIVRTIDLDAIRCLLS